MASPSLDALFLKSERAYAETQRLNAEIAAFRTRIHSARTTTVERDSQPGDYLVRLTTVEEPPLGWSVDLGEIVHNLRSSLDNLVYQLVCLNVGAPDPYQRTEKDWWTKLFFPIIYDGVPKTEKEWIRKVANGALHKMLNAHRDLIRDEQPYVRSSADPGSDFLARVHRLWNIDKHQTPHFVGHYVQTFSEVPHVAIEISTGICTTRWTCPPGPIKANEVLTRFSVFGSGPDPQVKIQPNFVLDISLEEPSPLSGCLHPLDQTLVGLWRRVDDVLRKFEPYFPNDVAHPYVGMTIIDKALRAPTAPFVWEPLP